MHTICICIAAALAFVIVCLIVYIRFQKMETQNIESNLSKKLDRKEEIIALLRHDMSKLCSFTRNQVAYHSQEDFRFYFELYGAENYVLPDDVYFINCYVPVKGILSDEKPYGDYTVYIPFKGECYHMSKTCSTIYKKAVHLYDVPNHYRPCPKCTSGKHCSPPEWYLEIKRIVENNKSK